MEMRTTETVQFPLVGFWEWEISPYTFSWSEQLHSLHGTDSTSVEPTLEVSLKPSTPMTDELLRRCSPLHGGSGRGSQPTYEIKLKAGCRQEFILRGAVVTSVSGEVVRMFGSAIRKTGNTFSVGSFPA